MRTARLLSIAGALGLALAAVLLWCGVGAQDAELESSRPALEVRVREGVRAETPGGAASIAFESSKVESAGGRPAGERAVEASSSVGDPTDPSFELLRETLATAVETHLRGLALSDNELDDLAQATLRLRRAQAALRTIPKTREHADQRARERRRLEEAVADFTYLVEMTPAEFSRRVEPGIGVDAWNPDATPVDVSIRPIQKGEDSE